MRSVRPRRPPWGLGLGLGLALALGLALLGTAEARGDALGDLELDEEDEAGARWRPTPHDDCRAEGEGPIAPFYVEDRRLTPRWIARTLHGVIADHCRSKTYQDLYALDGGTVGISHFASGSLRMLHQTMDAPYYFGRLAVDIPDRPYRFGWWRSGMRRFLQSPESRRVQRRAWRLFITPALRLALYEGWHTDRQLAIAAGVANSLGALGFRRLAAQAGWSPERTLRLYGRMTDHKDRRRLRIDREFPRPPRRGDYYSLVR